MTHLRPFHYLALTGALLCISCMIAGCTSTDHGSADQHTAPACAVGEIVFLTEELYPFSYAGLDGVARGQSVEVVRDLVRRLNCTAEIRVLPWSVAYDTAVATPGYAVFSTVKTPEREAKFSWVGPIALLEYSLYARNGSNDMLPSLEAARNAGAIAVVDGDARHDFLVKNNFSNIRTYPSDEECLEALLDGSVSLWMGTSATTPGTLARHAVPGGTVIPVYTLLRTELFIAFNRETSAATIDAYQDALDASKADGTFSRITGAGLPASLSPSVDGQRDTFASETLLPAFSALISARVHGIAAAMETLALTGELKEGDWEKIRPLLVRLEQEYPEARFWYARPDGSYYTTVDNLTSANLRDRPYFPGVLAGKTSIGTIVVSKSTGRYTAIIAVPVRDKGEVNGILGTSVYCDTLEKALFEEFALPAGYYAFAVDALGMPVIDSLPDRIFSLDESTRSAVREMREGQVDYSFEGAGHQAVFRTEEMTGWKVGIGWGA